MGALNLEITGFARFEAFGGEQDDRALDSSLSRGLDFRNDTEVHVIARGKSEETGLEYGATIEFEADTNTTTNTDETWIFLRGGWGEFRLGDEDGVVDNSVVGGQTIAAGTGGIDGSDAVITAAPVVFLANSNDATKVRYYTPSFGGFSLGVSYTPTQEDFNSGAQQRPVLRQQGRRVWPWTARTSSRAPLVYDGDLGGVGHTRLGGRPLRRVEERRRGRRSATTSGGASRPAPTSTCSASSSAAASATTRSARRSATSSPPASARHWAR